MSYSCSHSVIGSSYDPAWLTQSFLQGMHRDFKHVHLHPSVALKSQKQTYITFVSTSELFEDVCVAQPPRSWPSLCVCVSMCVFTPHLPPLILIFIFIRGTEPWQTEPKPQMSTRSTPLLFLPLLHPSHFPPTPRAPAPQRWRQLLFIH